jgi:hypothetical protein
MEHPKLREDWLSKYQPTGISKYQPTRISVTQLTSTLTFIPTLSTRQQIKHPATVVSDLILVFLPVWLFRNVHLDTKFRRRLLCVFAMALFATVFAIIRGVISLSIGGFVFLIWTAVEVRNSGLQHHHKTEDLIYIHLLDFRVPYGVQRIRHSPRPGRAGKQTRGLGGTGLLTYRAYYGATPQC